MWFSLFGKNNNMTMVLAKAATAECAPAATSLRLLQAWPVPVESSSLYSQAPHDYAAGFQATYFAYKHMQMKLCGPNRGSFCFYFRFLSSAAGYLGHSKLALGGIIHSVKLKSVDVESKTSHADNSQSSRWAVKGWNFNFEWTTVWQNKEKGLAAKVPQQQPLL